MPDGTPDFEEICVYNTLNSLSGIWNEEPISFQVSCEKGPNEQPD